MKKAITTVLILALVAGLYLYFGRGSSKPLTTGQAAVAPGVASAEEQAPVVDTGSTAEIIPQKTREVSESPAVKQRREVYEAMAQKLATPDNVLKRDEFAEQAQIRLDEVSGEVMMALGGDDNAARKLLERSRACRSFNPMTPLDVETEVAYYRDRYQRGRNLTDQQRQEHEARIEQTRAAMNARVDDCSWRHSADFPALRKQVEQQAERGDVMARFYYAMLLKPSPYEYDYLLETAAWSDNSLRFTMENINQNMTLGYLALSFSHSQGIFTHQDARLAGIWAYLVMSCPMRGPIAEPYLNTLLTNDRMEYLSATTVDIGQVWAQQVCP